MKIDKSAYINNMLYKELALINLSQDSSHPTQVPCSMTCLRFELRTTRLSVEHSNRAELTGHGYMLISHSQTNVCDIL